MQLKKLKLHSFLLVYGNHFYIPNKFIMLNMNVKCATEHLLFIKQFLQIVITIHTSYCIQEKMLSVKSTSLVKKWHISIQKCKKEKHGQLICTMTKAGLNVYSTVTCLDKKCIIPHYCLLQRTLLDNVSKPDNWICPTHPWKLY